ncbi:Uncharacterised protein [Bacteroides uniformis]|uniref:Uncharacterized protein n=1 Tax=Bacteroides uniformis TaxID=820 RepID=A0A174S285_BACUN|nr:Uncharacterised protein [Bacteroides uniformis]
MTTEKDERTEYHTIDMAFIQDKYYRMTFYLSLNRQILCRIGTRLSA